MTTARTACAALLRAAPAEPDDALEAHAAALYPNDAYLQRQWLRGVRLVRTTARGWLLDPPTLAVTKAPRAPAGAPDPLP